jgi:hypothetical protein
LKIGNKIQLIKNRLKTRNRKHVEMKIGNGNRLKIGNRNTINRNTGNKKQIEKQTERYRDREI